MSSDELITQLIKEYPSIVYPETNLPKAHKGQGEIKAIVLGADPTHIVDDKPIRMGKVFGLEKGEGSPYWRGINKNLQHIGLTLDNVYVQNVCRNYFDRETSKNNIWEEVARKYWIPFLKEELDKQFVREIPVLMTTQFALWAALEDQEKRIKAGTIYRECLSIPAEDNLLKRKLYAAYRHHFYSLRKTDWEKYKNYLTEQIKDLH